MYVPTDVTKRPTDSEKPNEDNGVENKRNEEDINKVQDTNTTIQMFLVKQALNPGTSFKWVTRALCGHMSERVSEWVSE